MNKKVICILSVLISVSFVSVGFASAYYFSLDTSSDKALLVDYTETGSCYDMSLEYYDGRWWCMYLSGTSDAGHSNSGQRYEIINATNFLDLNFSSMESVEPVDNPSNITELGMLWHNPYDDLLYCFFGEFSPGISNYDQAKTYYKIYNGTTDAWSEPILWSGPIDIGVTQNGHYFSGGKPIAINHNGSTRLLWAITYYADSGTRCGVLFSDDYGMTWENDSGSGRIYISNDDFEEPYLVELANGTVVMYMRHSTDKNLDNTWHVFRSYSTDDGMTWSNGVRTDVTSAVAKNHVSNWTISGENVYLMVNNYRPELSAANSWNGQRQRTNLSIRLSSDGWDWDNCTVYDASASVPFLIDPSTLGQGYDGTYGRTAYPDCYVKDDVIHVVVYNTHDNDAYPDRLFGYEIYLNDYDNWFIDFSSINNLDTGSNVQENHRWFNWTRDVNATTYSIRISNTSAMDDVFLQLDNLTVSGGWCSNNFLNTSASASPYSYNYWENSTCCFYYLPFCYNISSYGYDYYQVRAYTSS